MTIPAVQTRARRGSFLATAVALVVALGAASVPVRAESSDSTLPVATAETVAIDDAVNTAIVRIAEAGIAVVDEPSAAPRVEPVAPVSPVELLTWQVRTMVVEATHGAGMTAAELDATITGEQVETLDVTASTLVAGWAAHATTPAAAYARELLGPTLDNPATLHYSQLALVLFASDLAIAGQSVAPAEEAATTTPPTEPAGFARSPDVAARPCSTIIGFVDGVVARVFNAIGHLETPRVTGGGIFGDIVNAVAKVFIGGVNFVIDGAHIVVNGVTRIAIAPVLGIVGKIAGIAGTVALVGSAVRPWTIVMTPDPLSTRKAIGNEAPLRGAVTTRIELGGLDEWPSFLVDCAAQAGVALPPLKPDGNPVSWTMTPSDSSLAAQDTADPVLSSASAATLHYVTGSEPEFENPIERTGQLNVTATIRRDDITKLREAFDRLVQDGLASLVPPLGTVVAPLVYPRVKPYIDEAFNSLARVRDVTGTATVPVSYHVEGEPTSTPTSPASGTVRVACPSAADVSAALGQPVDGPDRFGPGDFPADMSVELHCQYGWESPAASMITFFSGLPVDDGSCPRITVPGALEAAMCVGGAPEVSIGMVVGDRAVAVASYDETAARSLAALVLATP